jgi:hypothetical protein
VNAKRKKRKEVKKAMSMTIALARAKAGARFLDEREGPGWERRINLDTLDIGSGTTCVAAQLNENAWCTALERYGLMTMDEAGSQAEIDMGRVTKFGFAEGGLVPDASATHTELTAAWKAEVGKRLAAARTVPLALSLPIAVREPELVEV